MKDYFRTLCFSAISYFCNCIILILFFSFSDSLSMKSVLFYALCMFAYAFLYTVPTIAVPGVVWLSTLKMPNAVLRRNLVHWSCVAVTTVTVLTLLFDLGLYRGWGFHINPLVYNLLTTPGGFASMGLRAEHIFPLVAVILFIAGGFAALGWLCGKIKHDGKFSRIMLSWKTALAVFLLTALTFTANLFWYGYESYMRSPEILGSAKVIPLYIPISLKSFLKKVGVKAPERKEILMRQNAGQGGLAYPAKAVIRDGKKMKYNVIWLACESWRADMLDAEIMPKAWNMAQNSVRFDQNYSGGNGTRMGVFSMFYGLYGNYWHTVLAARRGAVFIDWLLEDGYKFFCITSAKFSYPEFDHTVFAKLSSDVLFSDDNGRTFERDKRNVKRLCNFIDNNKDNGPFFAFMFFESPHAPYEFPPENELKKDYLKTINYASVSAKDGPALKRRCMNACNHLDARLGEVFDTVKKHGLEKNTIIVLVGDHGEEFFEKGRLGHNSTFVNEQLRTPLAIYIPGVKPHVYNDMSSHHDIVPMLSPYFGVTSDPADYCLGFNLLDGKSKRQYTVVSSWNELFFVGKTHKMLLPTTSVSAVTNKLYDNNDKEIDGKEKFFADNIKTLMKIQIDSQRFNR